MAHRIQRLPSALPWTFEQTDRRERQSDDVINAPKTLQSQTEVIDEGDHQAYERDGQQASEQALTSQDPQVISTSLRADAHPEAHQWAPEKQSQEQSQEQSREYSEEDHDSWHQTGDSQKICSELAPEALLGLDSTQGLVSSTPLLDLGLTFQLHSSASASKIIYLDFNGHTTSGTSWNDATMGTSFYSPAYDVDGNPAGFSSSELTRIQQVWQRVASDFAPFDVDVTTQAPPEDWLCNSGGSDANYGVRVIVTSYGPSSSYAGGIAFVSSFSSSSETPVFVYNTSVTGVSEAISHEVGHSLGLAHDGNSASEYYSGHGTGETGWAPIMGTSYNRNVTTWDNGTYYGSNNSGSTGNYGLGGDDLKVITSNNGFSYQPDLIGNDPLTAASLSVAGGTASQFGAIETRYDVDYYSFVLASIGDINLSFDPYWYRAYADLDGTWGGSGLAYLSHASDVRSTTPYPDNAANLDLQVQLYDSYGGLLYIANDPGLAATISLQGLSTGTYYLKLDGVGYGDPTASTPTGYSDYASIGNYMISGTITSAAEPTASPVITLALSSNFISEDGSGSLIYTFTRSLATANQLSVDFMVSGTATNGSDYTGLLSGGSQTVIFAANAATASVVIDPTSDSTVEADETVILTLTLGTNYTIGTTSVATGTISNDDLMPAPLVFTTKADILTGTTGADSFALNRLSDALWSPTPDRITNLQAGVDTIDSPFSRTFAIKPKQLGMVKTLDAAGIAGLLTSKNLAKNGASTFTFGDGSQLRTFLAINDPTPGFQASSDSVIEITGYAGSLSSLAIF